MQTNITPKIVPGILTVGAKKSLQAWRKYDTNYI
jgi:hypothetical protein